MTYSRQQNIHQSRANKGWDSDRVSFAGELRAYQLKLHHSLTTGIQPTLVNGTLLVETSTKPRQAGNNHIGAPHSITPPALSPANNEAPAGFTPTAAHGNTCGNHQHWNNSYPPLVAVERTKICCGQVIAGTRRALHIPLTCIDILNQYSVGTLSCGIRHKHHFYAKMDTF